MLSVAPNPFNPLTTIRWRLRDGGDAAIGILDLAGRRIRAEVLRGLRSGEHEFTWDGKDDRGRPVASGVYVVRLETADDIDVRRVALIK